MDTAWFLALLSALLAACPRRAESQQPAACASPRVEVRNFTVGWTVDVWDYYGSVAAHQWTYVPYTLGSWGGRNGTLVRVVVSQNITGVRNSSADVVALRSSTFTGGGNAVLYMWSMDYDAIPAGQLAFASSLTITHESDAQLEPWRSYQYGAAANFYFESKTVSAAHSVSANTTIAFFVCPYTTPPPPAPPPLSLASLEAQLAALQAQLPPPCNGSSFLQRTAAGGWACASPVPNLSAAAGWCRAAPSTGGLACDAAAPQPPGVSGLPPGGTWRGYNASAGGWVCVCAPGWTGPACATQPPIAGVSCGAPPPCTTNLYNYTPGRGFSCVMPPASQESPPPPSPVYVASAECATQTILVDEWRDIRAAGGSNCDASLQPGWYRLWQSTNQAYLVEAGLDGANVQATPHSLCGTDRGAVLLGPSHPAVADGIVSRQMYIEYGSYGTFISIQIRNCGTFYVYYLNNTITFSGMPMPFCVNGVNMGYCTTTTAPQQGAGRSCTTVYNAVCS